MQDTKIVKCISFAVVLGAMSTASMAATASLDSCSQQQATLGAHYQLDRVAGNKKGTSNVELWRQKGRVAQVSPSQGTTSIWFKTHNDKIKLDRLFKDFNRGIEYQPSDYRGEMTGWNTKYQLIPDSLLAQLKVKSTSGKGCELVEHRTGEINGQKHNLYWMPKLKLVKEHTMTGANTKMHVALKQLSLAKSDVKAQFDQWDSYQMIDYADVGDSESDPFVAKMINMGFVKHGAGFYNSDGTAIEGGHSHGSHKGHHAH